MNNANWINHLVQWRTFLESRILSTDDEGDRIKIARQIKAIEQVRYSAVLNPKLFIEFISPVTEAEKLKSEINQFYLELNNSQAKAVEAVLASNRYLSLIQGPPGTGKTQVISEICLQLCQRNPNVRILVCSETHVAVNNLITRISKCDASIRCLRIRDKENDSDIDSFSPHSVISSYIDWLENFCTDSDVCSILSDAFSETDNTGLEKALALSANVVGMTCNRIGAYRFNDSTEMFDYVIIDEVCKATLPEILMPLSVARRAVLVGDPKQLPPTFCSEDIKIIESIEDCNLRRYMYIDTLFQQVANTHLLDTQYRMEKSIGRLISTLFYQGGLKNGRNDEIDESIVWYDYRESRPWPEKFDNIIDGKQAIRNLDECKIIQGIIDDLEQKAPGPLKIAIITPYKQQAYELRNMISSTGKLNIIIDTVDAFQGKERDIVIFSLTRTSGKNWFLADERRLNVALSRAKDKIIIVGKVEYARKNDILLKIIKAAKIIKEN